MDKLKGFDYSVEVKGGIKEYAELVLVLTNLKSSRQDTVEHIKTIEGTNIISVVSQIDLDSFFKQYGAEIILKEDMEIIRLNSPDLKINVEKALRKLDDEDKLYHVQLDNADFMLC